MGKAILAVGAAGDRDAMTRLTNRVTPVITAGATVWIVSAVNTQPATPVVKRTIA